VDLTEGVVQQLREKAKLLRSLSDQLAAGEHLRAAVTRAQDTAVWTGAPQSAFCGWLDQLDRWVREQLATGVGKVAEEIDRHADDLDDAQRKLNNAVPGASCPAPAGRVRWAPTRPPEFVMQLDRAEGAVFMSPAGMEGLVTVLGQAKDAYYATGRQVEEALTPPRYVVSTGSGPAATPPSLANQVAAQLTPLDHIPPDASEACGSPALLPQALAIQLERALLDVLDRARKWARAAAVNDACDSGGLFGGLALLGAAIARAQAISVPTTEEASRQQGAADAARFAAEAMPKGRDCPDHDDVARRLEEIRAKAADNPAYAAGFANAIGALDYKFSGFRGNGFEYFARKVRICGTGGGEHEQRWSDLYTSMGAVFARATHAPSFDVQMAKEMLERKRSAFLFQGGPLRTDVALLVAEEWIKPKDWKLRYPLPLQIAEGLQVLVANPEAAHLYAIEHGALLSQGTDPALLDKGSYGFLQTAALAAAVLRIGLVEYPAQLADAAKAGGDTPAGQATRAAADDAKRKAEAGMAAAVSAIGNGARPGPEGRLVLAGFLATHVSDLASSLDTEISLPNWRGEHLATDEESIEIAIEEIMKDGEARKLLLAGADGALSDWSREMANYVGQHLEGGTRLGEVNAHLSGSNVSTAGRELGEFYGELANAIATNVKDAREAAAEVAGVMSFFISDILGKGAAFAGAIAGGGVAGLALRAGVDRLSKEAESYIRAAQERIPATNDLVEMKNEFMEVVKDQMEQMVAVSLWADARIRARLMAMPPPDRAGAPPPPTQPPLEDPPGTLRIPPPGEEPNRSIFFRWYEFDGGLALKSRTEGIVQSSGMLQAFHDRILEGLFRV
jgi:hypothetical protein